MKQLGKRLTYANVMSSLAVFLVLGGGALGPDFKSCASTGSVNLPTAGHVLLVASGEWDNDDPEPTDPEPTEPPNSGECRLSVDGAPVAREISFGEETLTHGIGEGGSITMNWITGQLSAGSHSFAFDCRETHGSTYIAEAMLSAVLLGSASVRTAPELMVK